MGKQDRLASKRRSDYRADHIVRRAILHVLAPDREFHAFYEKANGDNFLDFVGKVHQTFGKCVIFLDNASYHKSKTVRDAVKEFCGDVILEYLLPYTPDLNPVEAQWREQKRHTAGRYQGHTLMRCIKPGR